MRASRRLKGGFLFAVVVVFAALGNLVPTPSESFFAGADRIAFDAQMRLLRAAWPRPVDNDIVLIGIDHDTETAFPEPVALWHRHFAGVLHALAKAKPRAVGIDVVPPERSFDWVMPGSDLAMMRGLLDLKRAAPLVSVQTVNSRGALVPVQPNFRAILATENLGIDQQLKDADGVSRRYGELELSQTGDPVPTLVGQILRHLGMPVDHGFIDYSRGEPLAYVPMHQVAKMDETQLQRTFRDRIVLLGHLTRAQDRWPLPVKGLLANDPEAKPGTLEYTQAGVLVHLQVLRNHFSGGMLRPLPAWLEWALAVFAALAVLIHARPATLWAIAFVAPLLLLSVSLVAIVSLKVVIPLALVTLCLWAALVARGVFDAAEAVIERVRLRQSFEGQVSPAVLSEMLGGGLSPGVSGRLAEVCVLFSDVRDFTTLSENMPPEVVTTVLQRYFDRMVHAVHRFDGTVDKFIGDGLMVLFGAPRPSVDPCGDAVQCALAMMSELDALNTEFAREGLPTLVIGIGINYGTVTVGNIGSSERHNYSAIGDAVNVAARVEGLTKDLGRKVIITEAVVSRVGDRFHFDPLGSHKVKGHSPVNVWGIRTARVAPAAAKAEAVQ